MNSIEPGKMIRRKFGKKNWLLADRKMVGNDVALVLDLLVGDDVIEGEDAVVGKGLKREER